MNRIPETARNPTDDFPKRPTASSDMCIIEVANKIFFFSHETKYYQVGEMF